MVFGLALAPLLADAENVTVSVSNNSGMQRQELVEVPVDDVYARLGIQKGGQFIVKNALGQQVAYQVTYDGKLLIDASVRPNGTADFTITPGIPKPMKTYVCGRQYPERVDDIAWENDRTAYRVYGPALQRTGEQAFGIDVWVKNTPDLEVEKRYDTELSNHAKIEELKKAGKTEEALEMQQETTYHFDHGYGLDCYKVGPTLGCGTPALMDGGEMVMPYCYKTYKILDNGPLRFSARLAFGPATVGDEEVVERRVITLDKGTHLNRCEVTYEGLSHPCKVAAGIVVHKASPDAYVLDKKNGYVAYADPMDHPEAMNGQIYIACLFPEGLKSVEYVPLAQETAGGVGHAVGLCGYEPGRPFVYYFGSAWSKYDVPGFSVWEALLARYARALKAPLQVTVR